MQGKKRCKFHGGESLAGIAHPNWKHGKHSVVLKDLPQLSASYERARKNPALVQLTEEIALVDARNEQLLSRLQTGESADAWGQAREGLARLRAAQQARDGAAMAQALTTITQAVEHGENDAEIWGELRTNMFLRKHLVDSESKRRKDAHEMVTEDKLMAIVGSLVVLVGSVVTDRQQKQQIVDGVRRLMAGPTR